MWWWWISSELSHLYHTYKETTHTGEIRSQIATVFQFPPVIEEHTHNKTASGPLRMNSKTTWSVIFFYIVIFSLDYFKSSINVVKYLRKNPLASTLSRFDFLAPQIPLSRSPDFDWLACRDFSRQPVTTNSANQRRLIIAKPLLQPGDSSTVSAAAMQEVSLPTGRRHI